MRILLITEALTLGGAETFVMRLARRLIADGHEADVLCLNPDFEDTRLSGQFLDVVIHRIPMKGLRSLKRMDRVAGWFGLDPRIQQRRTKRWIERHLLGRFDIYHSHLFGADSLFAKIKEREPSLRLVSTLHGDYALLDARARGTERSKVQRWNSKLRLTIAAVDRWVTISPAQHRQFVEVFKVNPTKMKDIPNGYEPPVPVTAVAAPSLQGTRFVMVARGMREKGWGHLVDAFLSLRGDVSLLLVGEGAYLTELRDRHAGESRITFAGAHPNPVELIAISDVFVHPSFYKAESMPTVIIEALYASRPVIATRVGSVSTMIETPDGLLAGQLIGAEESLLTADLARAMQAYVDDPALLALHAARAPAAFAKFDMGKCAAAYAALYAEVLAERSSKSAMTLTH